MMSYANTPELVEDCYNDQQRSHPASVYTPPLSPVQELTPTPPLEDCFVDEHESSSMSEPVEMTPAGIPVRIEIGDGGENVPVSFTIAVPVETGDAGEHSPDEYVSTLPVAVPRIRRRLPCDDDAVMYESDDETAMGADDEEDVEHDLNVIRELLRTTLIRRNDDVE